MDFCLEHKIKCKVILQKPKDIVIISPGSLAFSKSNGNFLAFNWQLALNNKEQILRIEKQNSNNKNTTESVNNEIKQRYNDFPMTNYLAQYLNIEITQQHNRNSDMLNYCMELLRKKIRVEDETITSLTQVIKRKPLNSFTKFSNLPKHCEANSCSEEVFKYVGNCPEHNDILLCLECSTQHYKTCPFKHNFLLFNLVTDKSINLLFERVKAKIRFINNQNNNKLKTSVFNLLLF